MISNCDHSVKKHKELSTKYDTTIEIKQAPLAENNTVGTRINTPPKYKRTQEKTNSYQAYLRNLKLKPEGSLVKYYNGSSKPNNTIYEAVVDLEIGDKDLHQCADAVCRYPQN